MTKDLLKRRKSRRKSIDDLHLTSAGEVKEMAQAAGQDPPLVVEAVDALLQGMVGDKDVKFTLPHHANLIGMLDGTGLKLPSRYSELVTNSKASTWSRDIQKGYGFDISLFRTAFATMYLREPEHFAVLQKRVNLIPERNRLREEIRCFADVLLTKAHAEQKISPHEKEILKLTAKEGLDWLKKYPYAGYEAVLDELAKMKTIATAIIDPKITPIKV
jgi:hypothetical protein